MAKEGPTFVDKYIEKIVLAVCVLILLVAVGRYGMGTPKLIEIDSRISGKAQKAPDEVDKTILAHAERLKSKILSQKPVKQPAITWVSQLQKQQQSPYDFVAMRISTMTGMPLAVGKLPAETLQAPDRITPSEMEKTLPVPAAPLAISEQAIVITPKKGAPQGVEIADQNIAFGVGVYPVKEVEDAWKKLLKPTIVKLLGVFVWRQEVQVEVKMPDGSWQLAKTVGPRYISPKTGKAIALPRPESMGVFTGDNANELRNRVIAHNNERGWGPYLLQPPSLKLWDTARRKSIDWENRLFPWELLKQLPREKVVAPGATPPAGPPAGGVGPTPTTPPAMPGAGLEPGGEMIPGGPGMEPGMAPSEPAVAAVEPAVEQQKIPSFIEQRKRGKILVWSHFNNLEYGKQYRYRYRMVFFSPLWGNPSGVPEDKPELAKVQFVKSPWSPWSKPMSIQREMKYFVTGVVPLQGRQSVTVTVFTKMLGNWVKHEFTKIVPGQMIGGQELKSVINPLTARPEKMMVDFSTGASAVELLFQQPYYRGTRLANDGVKFIFTDGMGVLQSRIVNLDRSCEEFKALAELTKTERPRRRRPSREKDRPRRGSGETEIPPGIPMEPGMGPEMIPPMR